MVEVRPCVTHTGDRIGSELVAGQREIGNDVPHRIQIDSGEPKIAVAAERMLGAGWCVTRGQLYAQLFPEIVSVARTEGDVVVQARSAAREGSFREPVSKHLTNINLHIL